MMVSFFAVLFPTSVLYEILNLIESVSDVFSYLDQGGESCDLNDRVHEIWCRCPTLSL